MDRHDRAARMAQRVDETASSLGVDDASRGRLRRALSLAMEPRRERLSDDHDPAYLHPGRCAVILMDDLRERSGQTLTASVLLETERPELRVPLKTIENRLDADVAEIVASVPLPHCEELAAVLVSGSEQVRRLALAERLDQLRHAHLWADPKDRQRAHAQAMGVYLPVAERTHPTMARRFRWWCDMFERRYLS